MRENNFEDQVREKMDQLGFDPSDTVWTAVDKEINKDKKRRGPLFILFLFSGLLLSGGAIYFLGIKNYPDKKTISLEQKRKDEDQKKSSVRKDQTASIRENKISEKAISLVDQKKLNLLNGKKSRESVMTKSGNERTSSYNSNGIGDVRNNRTEENNVPPVPVKTGSENSGENKIDSSSLKKTIVPVLQSTALENSNTQSILATKDKPKGKTSLWTIGITTGAGISNTNQSLFKQSIVTGLYYGLPNTNAANVPYGAPAPAPVSSEINPGFSFSMGVFVSRYLSKRVSVSAGFNYHYYSTHINTGYAVDSSIIVNSPSYYNLGSTIPGAYAINGYYQSGTGYSYTNYYHFFELPVTADFQLNKSMKMPLYWEAGLSVSYLLSSNALHFDPNGNLYYQNALLFNKIQLNGTTAFMIGFPLNKNELRLGPELQYGLSGLLKSGSGDPQHLFYTGLKVSFIHGKK